MMNERLMPLTVTPMVCHGNRTPNCDSIVWL